MAGSKVKLIDYLPAIYHDLPDLAELLAVFEAVLFGEDRGSGIQKPEAVAGKMPFQERIDTISSLFDANETPKEFLPWLARWVALTHLEGLSDRSRRELLSKIVPLYAARGTEKYLLRMLRFFMPENLDAQIEDRGLEGVVVGKTTIGVDTWLGRDRPSWFNVTLIAKGVVPEDRQSFKKRWEQQIRRVIELAKPAHTLYEMDWRFQVGIRK